MSEEPKTCASQAAEPMSQVHRFDSETDPDIDVIDADNNTYKCHKAVLSQSQVLAKSFDPQLGFKESKEGVIALTHDDPSEVKAMLDYLYTKDYSSPCGEGEESLLFHVAVYTLGEIYAIIGLKEFARTRFFIAGRSTEKSHILASAIQAVYEATPESDRGLRDVAVAVAKEQIEKHMENREFREMTDGLGQFRKDLTDPVPHTFLVSGSQLLKYEILMIDGRKVLLRVKDFSLKPRPSSTHKRTTQSDGCAE